MNRIKQREQAFFLIFQNHFNAMKDEDAITLYNENVELIGDYAEKLYDGVVEKNQELEELISEFSTGWKINRIAKVNLSILKLALYEIIYVDDVPDSVAVNEAVELAKKYSSKEDSAFINGILGAYIRSKSSINE